MKSKQIFAVCFIAKEARNANDVLITQEGAECWLVDEPDGWVPATSQLASGRRDELPKGLKVFKSAAAADAFMQKWAGHPWYHIPKSWNVVPVTEHTKTVFSHYALSLWPTPKPPQT